MYRLTVLATGLLLATSAVAGEPAATPAQPSVPSAAAADKVYPPLPTLSMLPQGSDDDDESPARPTTRKKKAHFRVPRNAMPTPHLIVSDASRTYLEGVEQQVDQALAR